jgi:hypothetical protein
VDDGLVLDEVLDKFGTSRPSIDLPAQVGVKRDRLPTRGLSRLCPAALLLFLGAHDPLDLAFVLQG